MSDNMPGADGCLMQGFILAVTVAGRQTRDLVDNLIKQTPRQGLQI